MAACADLIPEQIATTALTTVHGAFQSRQDTSPECAEIMFTQFLLGIYAILSSDWWHPQSMIRRTFATRIPRCAPSDAPSKAAVQRLATLDEAGNQALRQARQGGDCCYSNSNASVGTFYEGAIVAGYPSDATDEMVQANVIATKYGSATAALETSTATGP